MSNETLENENLETNQENSETTSEHTESETTSNEEAKPKKEAVKEMRSRIAELVNSSKAKDAEIQKLKEERKSGAEQTFNQEHFVKAVEEATQKAVQAEMDRINPQLREFQKERTINKANEAFDLLKQRGASEEILEKMLKENPKIVNDPKEIHYVYNTRYSNVDLELEAASGKNIPSVQTGKALKTQPKTTNEASEEDVAAAVKAQVARLKGRM